MKKMLLPICAVTFLLAACNTEKKNSLETENRIVFTDTSLLKPANGATDVAANELQTPVDVAEKAAPKPQVRTITKIVRVVEKQPAPKVIEKAEPPVVVAPTQPATTNTGTVTNAGTLPGSGDTGNSTIATAPVEKKKNEGWSGAAKGATIGGVGGAVAGAVIGKGGKGAIIGGVIGAAGGYILGRKADKKSGRIEYTNN